MRAVYVQSPEPPTVVTLSPLEKERLRQEINILFSVSAVPERPGGRLREVDFPMLRDLEKTLGLMESTTTGRPHVVEAT